MNLFRYVYNWGLETSQKYYIEHGTYIGKSELLRQLSEYRNTTSWMKDIPLHSARLALDHLDFAYKKFFKGEARFPRFKSKKVTKMKVHYRNESYAFNFDETSVRIPGFSRNERILCKSHNIPKSESGYYSCTVTFDGLNYWLSVNSERNIDYSNYEHSNESLGIDVGFRKFAQLSNGTVYTAPKIIKTLDKRIRKQQSRLSKMKKRRLDIAKQVITKLEEIPCTKNEAKLKDQNLKLRIRRANIMNSFIHQTSTEIVNTFPKRIVMEDIKIMQMIKQRLNNRDSIMHSMWYKFREYVSYKAKARNIEFVLADPHFPSSQICSNCGSIKKTGYKFYICPVCGLKMDRDLNAAINLSRYA